MGSQTSSGGSLPLHSASLFGFSLWPFCPHVVFLSLLKQEAELGELYLDMVSVTATHSLWPKASHLAYFRARRVSLCHVCRRGHVKPPENSSCAHRRKPWTRSAQGPLLSRLQFALEKKIFRRVNRLVHSNLSTEIQFLLSGNSYCCPFKSLFSWFLTLFT